KKNEKNGKNGKMFGILSNYISGGGSIRGGYTSRVGRTYS
ncbi:hypothetical protein C5S39_13135, partial [Candidatus Methanophagaceae archaeon]